MSTFADNCLPSVKYTVKSPQIEAISCHCSENGHCFKMAKFLILVYLFQLLFQLKINFSLLK